MSVTVSYNGYNNIFSGLAPAPLISESTEFISFGERWATIKTLVLNGNLTGSCLNYTGAVELHSQLKQRFNKDFQAFQVKEDNNVVYNSEFASVKKITFPEQGFVNLVPFSIELQCYPRELFSGFYGVLDPQEEVEFSEREDGAVEITHTTSARGFNTSTNQSNALGNAKAFVSARTGWNSNLLPYFIDYASGISPVLTTLEENPNRFNGTYSVKETYISDTFTDSAGVLRYSIQTNSGAFGGPVTISVDGEINGGLNKTLTSIRSRFSATDFYGLAANSYNKTYNVPSTELNTTPLTKRVSENSLNNTISFNFQYDDDPTSNVFCDYTTRFDEDNITFNVISTIEGTVRGRGDRSTRWINVQDHYKDKIKNKLYDLLEPDYLAQNFKYTLNPNQVSKNETHDSFAAVISFSTSYDSTPIPPNQLEYFRYNLSFQPTINLYSEEPLLNISEYYVQDLDMKSREILTIQGQAKIKNTVSVNQGIDVIRSQIHALIQKYSKKTKRTIAQQNFTQGNEQMERFVSFNVVVSYEGTEFNV